MAGSVGGAPAQRAWPVLRDELRLYPGPSTRWGAPTWTLHDPPGQKFYRLGWLEMEILQRWGLGGADAIAKSMAENTTLRPSPDNVMLMLNFLVGNNLVVAGDAESTAAFLRQKEARRKSVVSTLLHNYLFLRIPLVKPDAFLSATMGWVGWMFSKTFVVLLLTLAAAGLFLVLREWSQFRDTLSSLLTLQGGIMAACALGLSKCLHELGHAYAAKRLGLRVPNMGIALMCFAPVLWTDTTEAWKLPGRKDRLSIGVSGVMAELILATTASILWPALPEGGLKTAAFMLASSVWVLTLTVNINPCMRYDGYYLLSDYWDVPGLQTRAFALAKWYLREQLFGLGLPPPEALPRWDRTKLIVYAFCTWIYRFFLFLGIAFLVYHLFFKALGIILMVVELAFFIALPILKEIGHWIKSREKITMNFRTIRTLVLFGAIGYFFLAPWHGRVVGAAMLTPERRAAFYAPAGSVVDEVAAENSLAVEKGDVLFRLRSPDVDNRIEIATRKLEAQQAKLSLSSLDQELRTELATEWEQLERLAEDLAGLLREREDLEIRAPFSGRMVEMPEWLVAGSWVQGKEPLAALVGGGGKVQTFVPEFARDRVKVGGYGLFYPNGKGREPIRIRIDMVEEQATREIGQPELASLYGGPLGAHKTAAGTLEAEQSVYRVVCSVEDGVPLQLLIGQASLEAEPRSLIADIWRRFMGILVRESGI